MTMRATMVANCCKKPRRWRHKSLRLHSHIFLLGGMISLILVLRHDDPHGAAGDLKGRGDLARHAHAGREGRGRVGGRRPLPDSVGERQTWSRLVHPLDMHYWSSMGWWSIKNIEFREAKSIMTAPSTNVRSLPLLYHVRPTQ